MPSKGRILIADDEPTFLEATADLLRQAGYECQTAVDVLSAAAELNTGQYDLLIADIQMPGNPGLELVRHLPRIAEHVPAIVVTAYPSPESRAESADLPVHAYLVKPFEFEDLVTQVRQCMIFATVHRVNRTICKRLDAWREECNSLDQMMSKATPGPAAPTPEAMVRLMLKNTLGLMNELHTMWQRVVESRADTGDVISNDFDSLGEALRTALAAYEAAARSFK